MGAETKIIGACAPTIAKTKNPGPGLWKTGGKTDHQVDLKNIMGDSMQGSRNIRHGRWLIWAWYEHHWGTKAGLEKAWKAMEGYLKLPYGVQERNAGGSYGYWNLGGMLGALGLAQITNHPLESDLYDYCLQDMIELALGAQPNKALSDPMWKPRPFNINPKPEDSWNLSTVSYWKNRSWIDPSLRSGPMGDRFSDGARLYFNRNRLEYGRVLSYVLGKGGDPKFVAEVCAAAKKHGAKFPKFMKPEDEAAISRLINKGELGSLVSKMRFRPRQALNFIRLTDGERICFADRSDNPGSTFYTMAARQDKAGRRTCVSLSHPGGRSFGQMMKAELRGDHVHVWTAEEPKDRNTIPEWDLKVGTAPIQWWVKCGPNGAKLAQGEGGGGQPAPLPPSQPPTPQPPKPPTSGGKYMPGPCTATAEDARDKVDAIMKAGQVPWHAARLPVKNMMSTMVDMTNGKREPKKLVVEDWEGSIEVLLSVHLNVGKRSEITEQIQRIKSCLF